MTRPQKPLVERLDRIASIERPTLPAMTDVRDDLDGDLVEALTSAAEAAEALLDAVGEYEDAEPGRDGAEDRETARGTVKENAETLAEALRTILGRAG